MAETRAERRRREREEAKGEWTPHDASTHQSIGSPAEQVMRHTQQCARCQSGSVATFGCPWLRKFFTKNQHLLGDLLGSGIYLDELDEYQQRKQEAYEARIAAAEEPDVHEVDVDEVAESFARQKASTHVEEDPED